MKLKLRLTLWFLAISLIPMVVVIAFSFSMTRHALLLQIFNQLESLANVQNSRVDSLLSERRLELAQFAERPQLRGLLQQYFHNGKVRMRELINELLTSIQLDQPHYKAITLLDLRGNVIASTDRARRGQNFANSAWFQQARVQSEVSILYGRKSKNLILRATGPLVVDEIGGSPISISKHIVGVCVIDTDADALVNLLAERNGLGESEEGAIVYHRPNTEWLVITPVHDSNEASMRFRVGRPDKNDVGVRALTSDDRSVYETIDPHGVSVYAAARHIDAADWGLVVKRDEDEALQPIHRLGDYVLWAVVGLVLLTVFVSFSLARSITEPLEGLTQAAQRASEGDLSTRVHVRSEDEMGILGNAFNHMAFNLETMHAGLETKVRERTAELEAANTRLKELDRVKSEFLATMSHELRTPLNSIMGFSEILLTDDDGSFDGEQGEQLRCIYNSARHLLKIIEEILDVSKIEAGRMETEPQWFGMRDLVRQAADILRPQATQKRLQIVLDVPDDPTMIHTDPSKILRVLVNLLGNAIKFTNQGSVTLRLERRDGPDEGRIFIEVRDTGIGIRDEDLAQLFQPFKQVDSSTRRQYEGTGLGLYYSRKVVELLGGALSVRSVWQKGSSFVISVPVRSKDAPPRPADLEQAFGDARLTPN